MAHILFLISTWPILTFFYEMFAFITRFESFSKNLNPQAFFQTANN